MRTKRLLLRKPNLTDENFFFELENDPEIYRYLPPGRPFDRSKVRDRLYQYIDKKGLYQPFGFWMAELKNTRERVGYGLLLEVGRGDYRLGYVLAKKYWNQGYATELSHRIITYGFEKGLTKINAVTSPENQASQEVLKKLGFSFLKMIEGETPGLKLCLFSLSKK